MTPPSTETLVRWLIAVGGVVTGVGTTVVGSWISSRIHVYQENRKVHLDEIKQKVLLPLKEVLTVRYVPLIKHKALAVAQEWGTRKRIEGASVMQSQTEQGPFLSAVLPDIRSGVETALYADAKKKHYSALIQHFEKLDEAWRAHAQECHAWVVQMSEEIIAKSGLDPFPVATHGKSYVDNQKLGLFIYRRLFPSGQHSLVKHSHEHPPVHWVLEGFEGTSAEGTEQQLLALIAVLDKLMVAERNKADELNAEAQKLDRNLVTLMAEIDYAIAYRRLRKRCDLVPFF
jgi:hypothetical protein